MQALIDFISSYEPLYAQIVRGYPEEKIVELETALGRRLPGAYRDFLATMAANMGFLTGEFNFDIDPIIEITADLAGPFLEHLVLIAEDEGPLSYDFYLDLSHPFGDDDALVIRICSGAKAQRKAVFWSLRDMLFSWAFANVRMLTLTQQTEILWLPSNFAGKKMPSFDDLKTVMTRLSFAPLTVTSRAAQLYERGDCAACVYQVPYEEAFSLKVAARDMAVMMRVAEVVRDALPQNSS